ncbi:MAG: hypothetical protein H7645_04150 [Candidatus Heimdallarchaeota archaeon]|nr:hypothetical protein [Candidatus Heimdallarchaeota archaeon]MCK4769509.1 hypothetical protein [Candidatus Heimdallarchaeota archaeon]
MSDRDKMLETFIEMLKTIIPNVISVYEFTKELALFDRWMKDKIGLVIILEKEDYSIENLLLIDLVYDKIQDEFGWELGTAFASSFSRGYIRTKDNVWHINIQNSHCLLPEDMLNLKNTGKLLFGEDAIPKIAFPHQEKEILNINIGLLREEADKIAEKYPQYQPLINPECCFARHDFTVNHSIVKLLEHNLVKIKDNILPEKNVHLYGRYRGSGKTQIMYSLMKKCKELEIPFVYRSEFWKDEAGKYKKIDHNPENDPKAISGWVAKSTTSASFVLFLDEVEIDIEELKTELKERFSDYDPMFYIISGGKEISDFTKEDFDIYDIVREYPFNESLYKELLGKLIEESNLDKIIFSDEIIDKIIKKTQLWNHSSLRKTPTAVILSATLSLVESIIITEETKVPLTILPETAEKWALLGTSPWYQKHGDLHDVHAEFLVFNGKEYSKVDEHYKHPLP